MRAGNSALREAVQQEALDGGPHLGCAIPSVVKERLTIAEGIGTRVH